MKKVIGGKLIANGKQVPVSKGVRAGDYVFVSGQLAFTDGGTVMEGDTKQQTMRALELIQGILAEEGLTMDHIVKCTAWITSADEFSNFNEAYATFFGEHPPARSCLISAQLLLGAKVEIEAIAYDPQ